MSGIYAQNLLVYFGQIGEVFLWWNAVLVFLILNFWGLHSDPFGNKDLQLINRSIRMS